MTNNALEPMILVYSNVFDERYINTFININPKVNGYS